MKLEIEPIPISTWGISLANRLESGEWDQIRQKVYRDANYTCKICGGSNRTLHCHEKWVWDDKKLIQRLVGFECCCELCHDVHHFGRSKEVKSPNYVSELVKHWCWVNRKKRSDFIEYERRIFELNKKRANKFYIVKVGRRALT